MSSKGLQTRQNIITKPLYLFSVKGYYNTSVNDILGATNLTKVDSTGILGARKISGMQFMMKLLTHGKLLYLKISKRLMIL